MKKIFLFIVLFVCVFLFSAIPTHAASELEDWCLAQGQRWVTETSLCAVETTATVSSTEELTVLVGETIVNGGGGGKLYNYGTITNNGEFHLYFLCTLYNHGHIYNHGYMDNPDCHIYNHGHIYNYSHFLSAYLDNDGTIYNYGWFHNWYRIKNYGNINNYGSISNDHFINNFGTILNCGNYSGPLPTDNPIEDGPCVVQTVQELIEMVEDLNLQQGVDNSLDAKLDAALKAQDDLNENNDVAAVNALQAFINAVEAQRGGKISDSDADTLILNAQALIDAINAG